MGKNICKWCNQQGLISKKYKQLIQLKNKKVQWKNGQNTLTDISPKTYRWSRGMWKEAQHYWLLEKCKSKLQWGITSHQTEWPSPKNLQTINVGCREKWNLLYCWWECKLIQPLWRTVQRCLKKLGIKLPYDPAIPTCCFLVTKLCLTLLQPRGLQPARVLCPWDFPDKNTGAGCHFLLQGMFPTWG